MKENFLGFYQETPLQSFNYFNYSSRFPSSHVQPVGHYEEGDWNC